jgi:coupling of ubiquitin conjugation to ER degradation protein 1
VRKPQSLIERYNLGAKVTPEAAPAASAPAAAPAAAAAAGGKWEANREDREKDLRARKERMILEARK